MRQPAVHSGGRGKIIARHAKAGQITAALSTSPELAETNGGIIGKCAPPPNSGYYEMETTANPVTGPWSTPIVSTNSQNIPA